MVSFVSIFIILQSFPHYEKELNDKFLSSLYFQNINSSNKSVKELGEEILKEDPDLIGLIETSPGQDKEFDLILKNYQERISLPREDNFGFSIYSKFPLRTIEIATFQEIPVFIVLDNLRSNTKIILVHLPPPLWKEAWEIQDKALSQLEKYWMKGAHVIMVGDFNMTPWSPFYKSFFYKINPAYYTSNLNFQGSWPSFLPAFLQLPIDHVFSTQPFDFKILPAHGSDHIGFLLNYKK